MLFNLHLAETKFPADRKYDVCVIGAGAAGITIAKTLAEKGKTVALIEGGGDQYSSESQHIYQGDVIGDPYFDLRTARLRYLGGSTNHWGGRCRSFEEIDFQRQYLGEQYNWPISFSEIEKYKTAACEILEIPDDFEPEQTNDADIKDITFQFSPPVRFKDKFSKLLNDSDKITLFINANLTQLYGQDGTIHAANFESFSEKKILINASQFVFAMGGIENSRFLMHFDAKNTGAFFAKNLPLGKYWMEHPHLNLGRALVDTRKVNTRHYSLSGRIQKELGILNCGFRVIPYTPNDGRTKAMVRDLLCAAPTLGKKVATLAGKNLICGAKLRAAWEQEPTISNAVQLSQETDIFGIPKVQLHWKKSHLDMLTIKESVRVFNTWLMAGDAGRLQLDSWMLNDGDAYPEQEIMGGNHHMGGTRMSTSVRYGVTDNNGQVFGSKNLFIAGSSVFTTGGHNNPTLPIVQLSLRLAEHLSQH